MAGAWRHPGDPVFDEWLRPQIRELADVVATEGVPVFWSEVAHVRMARPNDPTSDWRDHPDNDPARVDRMNELYREEIEGRPGFTLLPVDQWLHGLRRVQPRVQGRRGPLHGEGFGGVRRLARAPDPRSRRGRPGGG